MKLSRRTQERVQAACWILLGLGFIGVHAYLPEQAPWDLNLTPAEIYRNPGPPRVESARSSEPEESLKPENFSEPKVQEYLTQDRQFKLRLVWTNSVTAAASLFTGSNLSTISWTTELPLQFAAARSLRGNISEDGDAVVLETAWGFRSSTPSPLTITFIHHGKRVRSIDLTDAQKELDKQNSDFALEDLWTDTGSIRFFDEIPEGRLYCRWFGGINRWLAWDARTGEIAEVTEARRASWNTKGRNWVLACLKLTYPEGPRSMQVRDFRDSGLPKGWNEQLLHFEPYYSLPKEALFAFLAAQRLPEDKPWIEGLLLDPLSASEDYHNKRLSGSSFWRNVGDTLLAEWLGQSGRLRRSSLLRPFFHPGDYVHLGTVYGFVTLPFAPNATEGSLHLVAFSGTNEPGSSNPSMLLSWHMKSIALNLNPAQEDSANASQLEIPPTIEYQLEGLLPGSYRLQALWRRKLPSLDRSDVFKPEPGDYLSDLSQALLVEPGDHYELSIICTNRIKGEEGAYSADAVRLVKKHSAQTNLSKSPGRDRAEERRWRERFQPISHASLTNRLGPLTFYKITYGTLHRYHSAEVLTEKDALVVWFSGDRDYLFRSHPSRCFEVVDSRRQKYGQHIGATGVYPDAARLQCLKIEQWPRHEKALVLRYQSVQAFQHQFLGRIELPNLAWREFPE